MVSDYRIFPFKPDGLDNRVCDRPNAYFLILADLA